MSENETGSILCGACRVPVKISTDAEGGESVICPTCGASDSMENAVRQAAEYILDKGMREGLSPVDLRGMTITHPPERNYRFIFGG